MKSSENTPSHTQNLNMISNVALADVSTNNQESFPPAEADNILPPMPLDALETEKIPWTVIYNLYDPMQCGPGKLNLKTH